LTLWIGLLCFLGDQELQGQGLETLRIPPGNQLEALKRDRQGQQSIRINDQWRICFVWRAGDAVDVEIVDYH
jgi:proteic killer suppression protein